MVFQRTTASLRAVMTVDGDERRAPILFRDAHQRLVQERAPVITGIQWPIQHRLAARECASSYACEELRPRARASIIIAFLARAIIVADGISCGSA